MRINWGLVPLNSVLPFVFDSYDGTTGASEAISGLAITDVEIFKGTSMTQRSSDSGVVLLDTDGIDIDGIVGINGFSIDTSDNTDAGFFVAGAFYYVIVASITADAQTVNFVAGTFWLGPATAIAGQIKVDIGGWNGTAVATPATAGIPDVNTKNAGNTAWGSGAITAASIASDAITDAKVASDVTIASVTGAVGSVTGAVGSVTGAVGSVTGAVGSVTGAVGSVAAGGISEASFATTAGTFAPFGIVDRGTAQSATNTTLVLRAAAAFADSELVGATVVIRSATAGAGQRRLITANVNATDTITVDTWTTTPTGTIVYDIFGSAPSSATSIPAVNVTQWLGTAASTPTVAGVPNVNAKTWNDLTTVALPATPTNITAGVITTVTNLTNAPTNGDFTATMKTSIGTAVAASAVASVTAGVTVTTNNDKTGYRLDATGSAALTESYAVDGAAATLPQLLYLILAALTEFSISGTTMTYKKLDGSTSAATGTLDSASAPTSITRAT